mgnify:CR=1 FL=1
MKIKISAALLGGLLLAAGFLMALLLVGGLDAIRTAMVIGALPFWDALRRLPTVRRALLGVNAAVVGLLVELIPTGGAGIGTGSPERMVTSIRGGETKNLTDIIATGFLFRSRYKGGRSEHREPGANCADAGSARHRAPARARKRPLAGPWVWVSRKRSF